MNMPLSTARRAHFSPFGPGAPLSPAALRRSLKHIRGLLDADDVNSAALAVETLVEQTPYDIRVLSLGAQCRDAKGDHEGAIMLQDRLLTQQDSDVVWAAKARSLVALGRYRRASLCFARASTLARNTRFIAEHAACLLAAGKPKDALTVLETTQSTKNRNIYQKTTHAAVLTELGKHREAYQLASDAANDDETGDAVCLAHQNMVNRATFETLCKTTALHCSAPRVLSAIAASNPEHIPTKQTKKLIQITNDTSHTQLDQVHAHLALFRIYDHAEDSFQALAHLRKYHALLNKTGTHNRSQDSALFAIIARLNSPCLQRTKTKVLPIFVCGLPGSGRRSAADVLAQAAGRGVPRSLSVVPAVMKRFISNLRARKNNEIGRDDMLSLQSELRSGLEQAANGDDVLIDTTSSNFRWSGLLAAALPEARIVQMRGNPMATGWAMHRGDWRDPAFECHHNLEHVKNFLHRSTSLMAHWEFKFAPNVMGISGDALARPSGSTAKAMVDACDLKWSEKCIQPPYCPDRSWYRYAAYLNPLRPSIEPSQNLTCDQSAM